MSAYAEIHKRVPIPFDAAKAMYERDYQQSIRDDWHGFLAYWGGLNYDAAEAFVTVASARREAWRQSKALITEAA